MKHISMRVFTLLGLCFLVWILAAGCFQSQTYARSQTRLSRKVQAADKQGRLTESWSCKLEYPTEDFAGQKKSSEAITPFSLQDNSFSTPAMNGQTGTDKLTGQNLKLYKALRAEILKLARGERKKSRFTFTPDKILGKCTFTEQELGVTIYDESTGRWGNDYRIEEAIYQLSQYSLATVLYQLMVDYPYELFWFDKTVGVFSSRPGSYTLSSKYGGSITIEDSYIFRFAICRSYADTASDKFINSDSIYYLTSKSSRFEAAREASLRAKALVKDCARLSDYDKIMAYCHYILDAVSYNFEAEESEDYGDPWQLIYVFDENPRTNVVCEGYSKAMKYLCDLTSWDSPYVDCRLVAGLSVYQNNRANHMWNIIHMPRSSDYTQNGGTFLLDLTNSDEGAIGDDESLLFASRVSGSLSDGYQFRSQGTLITYRYLTPALSAYKSGQLTISSGHYDYYCQEKHTFKTKNATYAKPHVDGMTEGIRCSVCGWQKKIAKIIYAPEVISFSLDPAHYTYNGKVRHPSVKVYNNKGLEIEKLFYKISWPDATNYMNPGIYRVKISFIRPVGYDEDAFIPYRGSFTRSFRILPPKTSISRIDCGNRKLTLHWEKQTLQTSGYQIQMSAGSSFSEILRTKTITDKKVNKYLVEKLSRNKKYYFRIRCYKLVDGKRIYSKWSTYKSGKTLP